MISLDVGIAPQNNPSFSDTSDCQQTESRLKLFLAKL